MLLEHQNVISELRSPSRWKELSKKIGSKILPVGDGSCGKTFKPIASLIAKGKINKRRRKKLNGQVVDDALTPRGQEAANIMQAPRESIKYQQLTMDDFPPVCTIKDVKMIDDVGERITTAGRINAVRDEIKDISEKR
ncbi:hypothetical protein Tco_0465506 [Tanacetum coccineum]